MTSNCWPKHSCCGLATWRGKARSRSNPKRARRCCGTPGLETCASWKTPSSERPFSRKIRPDPLVSDTTQLNPTLDTIERAYILWVLENEGGSKPRTAEVLGIDASTLYRKLSRYGLEK